MLPPFTAQIESTLYERVREVEEHSLIPDPRYKQLTAKIDAILDQIEQNLGPEEERLLLELDDFWIERDVLAYGRMYRQGLVDGMVVNRILRMARKKCRE